jgi:hypothetical protein
MAKKPKLSGSTKAVMRKPDPAKRPRHWKFVWPILKTGSAYHNDRPTGLAAMPSE